MASYVRGFGPDSRVAGEVRVPGSKSIAQRLLVCGGLTSGRTHVVRLPLSRDVQDLIGALEGLGVEVQRPGPAAVSLTGQPPGPHRGLSGRAMVGESGTAARLLTAAAGLCGRAGQEVLVECEGSLSGRSSAPLFEALRSAGVGVEGADVDAAGGTGLGGDAAGWPARLEPIGPPSELLLQNPVSSQEVSALWIALAAFPGEHLLRVAGEIPSRPYLGLTLAALGEFGVQVEALPAVEGEEAWLVRGPLRSPEAPLQVEPDASAAAVALAAGCLSGGDVLVRGLGPGSRQGDVDIVRLLGCFGCEASFVEGGVRASGRPDRGADLDLRATPDLAPVLAAVAGAACLAHGAPSRLEGLGTLPGKESSRIEVLASGLGALGLEVEAGSAHLAIAPGRGAGAGETIPPTLTLDPHGDHRMAFAFGLLGLVHGGITVRDPGCVAKSWPSFWEDLEQAGARASC